mmetsp:Transcript_960/g.3099  ORF Transcript_960/g.3099 Transcript_960/m.3099 type:complete len:330 (-) Transcript_960:153-1142(-)
MWPALPSMFSTAAMPSSSALCASIGPATMSPMAHTPGTLVLKSCSMMTRPALSCSTPASFRPRPSVYGRRPVATSTTSTSMVSGSPPALGSMVSFTPSGPGTAPVTLVLYLNLKPCFFSVRSKVVRIWESRLGTMPSVNSTTVTCAPRRLHTEPISRPMTPPPMTTIFLGTSFRLSAPVELTIFSSSIVMPGRSVCVEPVARSTFLVVSVSLPPSASATSTVSPLPASLPQPLTYFTLFFLNRPSMPLVRPPTAFSLDFIISATFTFTAPSISMPCFLKFFWASWYRCVVCSSALDGMQPTLRHVPPRVPRPSTHATLMPSWAALIAAT